MWRRPRHIMESQPVQTVLLNLEPIAALISRLGPGQGIQQLRSNGGLALGNLYVEAPADDVPAYAEYQAQYGDRQLVPKEATILIGATEYTAKNFCIPRFPHSQALRLFLHSQAARRRLHTPSPRRTEPPGSSPRRSPHGGSQAERRGSVSGVEDGGAFTLLAGFGGGVSEGSLRR